MNRRTKVGRLKGKEDENRRKGLSGIREQWMRVKCGRR